MLITEGGTQLLQDIINNETTNSSIKHFARMILDVLDKENVTSKNLQQ